MEALLELDADDERAGQEVGLGQAPLLSAHAFEGVGHAVVGVDELLVEVRHLADRPEAGGEGAGIALTGVGLLFKIGAVPFQSWKPDVYQGAPTPITALMASCTVVSAFGALGKGEVGYFKMVNERGGINGRKVNLISLDDSYAPTGPRTSAAPSAGKTRPRSVPDPRAAGVKQVQTAPPPRRYVKWKPLSAS